MIENNDNKNFWIYNNKIFSEQDAINYYGFVYLITNLINNKMYVGKKYFCMNEISAEKISLKLKNKSKSETHRKALSEVHKGHKSWNIGKKVPNSGNNKGRVRTEENKKKISETLKRLYRTGIVQHPRKNKLVSEETRKKMGELCIKLGILKEKIHIKEKIFITRYRGLPCGVSLKENNKIIEINNFIDFCNENKISFGALLVWSKRNRNNKRIHPKYNIKILKIHNKILNKTFFNYLENYLNLIKEGNDELKTK